MQDQRDAPVPSGVPIDQKRNKQANKQTNNDATKVLNLSLQLGVWANVTCPSKATNITPERWETNAFN